MRSIIQWAVKNSPAVNIMVLAVLLSGGFCFFQMRREVFPEFELEVILVSVPYPGASPADVESGICQPIEEAVRSIDGLKQMVSIAREGGGYVMLELNSKVGDVQKTVDDVRNRTARIQNFPELAEKPNVEQITFRETAIKVAVLGPDDRSDDAEVRLREVAEEVKEGLLAMPTISQAEIRGGKNYQIDVEISEDTLRKHNLTLGQVAQILRRENAELPGGQLQSDSQKILLRGTNRREIGSEIRSLPIITQPSGAVLTAGDLGRVVDQFEDSSKLNEINGQPAMILYVQRTAEEDLIKICQEVHSFAETAELPYGYSLEVWGDTSVDVADRMRMLRDNGMQGLVLVFILLALFMDLRLAFWVSMGIPIAVAGAGVVLLLTGQTLNMLSLFAFLMALGIVVDDAIVVGENIYSHRLMGKGMIAAAIDGTLEVVPSVVASVSTTMIAFLPFFFVTGVMGKFIAVMPVAIIAMLAVSLVESATALPCHLSHGDHKKGVFGRSLDLFLYPLEFVFSRLRRLCSNLLEWISEHVYGRILSVLLKYPLLALACSIFVLFSTASMVKSGFVPFVPFPSTDSNQIFGQVVFADGTPAAITDKATEQIEQALFRVSETILAAELAAHTASGATTPPPPPPVKLSMRQVGTVQQQNGPNDTGDTGSSGGQVMAELADASLRNVTSTELIALWRKEVGEIQGAERLVFRSANPGPGGNPIEFRLLGEAKHEDQLRAAVEAAKAELAKYPGVHDIQDDANEGKTEYQIRIKDRAQSMGITTMELAERIRHTYYGAEAMRIQRGRQEVKLMVRYPEKERTSLTQFNDIMIRSPNGTEIPITELADITVTKGYSEINRLNQRRAIKISADVDVTENNATNVITDLQTNFLPDLLSNRYPEVGITWEGQQKTTMESLTSLALGTLFAMIAMYLLLVIEFRSYLQPMLIMAIVPFGIIGAIWGHAIMGLQMSLFSFFGLVALTGVVVNDSIVLVDFINSRVRAGVPVFEALQESGRRRLRPVFLTSATTVGGLAPMLMETSFQAQFLTPMATSIAFGLMMSTFLVLLQVPVLYLLYAKLMALLGDDLIDYDVADLPPSAAPEVATSVRPSTV